MFDREEHEGLSNMFGLQENSGKTYLISEEEEEDPSIFKVASSNEHLNNNPHAETMTVIIASQAVVWNTHLSKKLYREWKIFLSLFPHFLFLSQLTTEVQCIQELRSVL